MKKVLMMISLFFITSVSNVYAGLLSEDDLFVGFWKQYGTDANGQFILSRDEPHLQGYLEIKKDNDMYTIVIYDPVNFHHKSVNNAIVTGYAKNNITATSKGGTLIINLKKPRKGLALLIYSKNNGKSVDFVTRNNREKLIKSYEKIDKDQALNYIKSKKENRF